MTGLVNPSNVLADQVEHRRTFILQVPQRFVPHFIRPFNVSSMREMFTFQTCISLRHVSHISASSLLHGRPTFAFSRLTIDSESPISMTLNLLIPWPHRADKRAFGLSKS